MEKTLETELENKDRFSEITFMKRQRFDVIGFCKRVLGIDQSPEPLMLPRLCKCGCGGVIKSESKYTRYLPGHNTYDPENVALKKKTCIERYGSEFASSNSMIKEKTKQTNIKRYGCAKPLQYKEFMEKRNNTCIELYGTKDPCKLQQFKDKTCETDIKKYGCKHHVNSSLVQEKIKRRNTELFGVDNVFKLSWMQKLIRDTFMRKYNVANAVQNENVKEKIRNTCLEKYGEDNYFKTKEFIQKCKKTCLEKYQVPYFVWSPIFLDKFIETCRKKYNCDFPMQNREIRSKSAHRYFYDCKKFDSTPEICLYIYLKDNNIDFEYQPNIWYEYVVNNTTHKYFPDFRIRDKYYEIKGDHFFEDCKMINPFDRSMDYIYECKHQCMIKNNVCIMRKDEYQKYLDYVEIKYGKNYLKQFKNCQRPKCG